MKNQAIFHINLTDSFTLKGINVLSAYVIIYVEKIIYVQN